MTEIEITKQLFAWQDLEYRNFMAGLIPNIKQENIIGVRTPLLRSLAKGIYKRKDADDFLNKVPHKYFELNQLHSFIICEQKDFDKCITLLENFLPYIDNWATCDQLLPKVFKKHHEKLLPHIQKWLKQNPQSNATYTVRFAIGMLMQHFLDEDFDVQFLEQVSCIKSQEYYVNMMIAWYFATALAKQYNSTLPLIEQRCLEKWTHNKTIQKAIESRRITNDQKAYLKGLKI